MLLVFQFVQDSCIWYSVSKFGSYIGCYNRTNLIFISLYNIGVFDFILVWLAIVFVGVCCGGVGVAFIFDIFLMLILAITRKFWIKELNLLNLNLLFGFYQFFIALCLLWCTYIKLIFSIKISFLWINFLILNILALLLHLLLNVLLILFKWDVDCTTLRRLNQKQNIILRRIIIIIFININQILFNNIPMLDIWWILL